MSDVIIKVEELTKKFYVSDSKIKNLFKRSLKRNLIEVTAVNQINFEVERGTIVGFIGPNGAGKSTTIKMLTGTLHPSNGKISVDGFIPYERKLLFRREIALVMGNKQQLIPDLTPMDYFKLIGSLYDLDEKRLTDDINSLTSYLNVKNKLYRQVRSLSLGEKMKMEFISAALIHPKILFLDEPTIGLDVQSKKDIRQFLLKLNREEGTTIILTSHDMEDIAETCKKIIVISEGSIVLDDEVSKTISKYSNFKYVRIPSFYLDRTDFKHFEGIEIIDNDSSKTLLKVDSFQIANVIKKLVETNSIDDFEIINLSLEEIILQNYSLKGEVDE